MKLRILLLVIIVGVSVIQSCKKKTGDDPILKKVLLPVDLKLDTLIGGLTNPWSLEFIGQGKILITLRQGSMVIWDKGALTPVTGLPAFVALGQGGLLDVAKHPQFDLNHLIYFCGSTGTSSAFSTSLFSAELNGNQLINVKKLFQATPIISSQAHFGSRIVFDAKGHVFLSLGERNQKAEAQNRANHSGCVIRLMEDGSVPTDNPFVDSVGMKPEIWTWGHRNVQGMALHPATGEIWTHEHGPKGGDEINILKKGANYGWPLATFGIDYNGGIISKDTFVVGTELPIYYWVPSIAPCGMTFYKSDSIPQWDGHLFIGALVGEHLNHLTLNGDHVKSEERLLQGYARFRAVKQGPDGYLYFVTETPGYLMRFKPK